jgi:hypothetical protein
MASVLLAGGTILDPPSATTWSYGICRCLDDDGDIDKRRNAAVTDDVPRVIDCQAAQTCDLCSLPRRNMSENTTTKPMPALTFSLIPPLLLRETLARNLVRET